MNDLRFAIRQLLKNPGFTIVAVLTLALGIGANTAIFSVVNAVLLRPLPYKDSSQLVMIWQGRGTPVSPLNFLDYEKQNRVFEQMATFNAGSLTLTEIAEPERIRTGLVTADFFEVLGVRPILGRTFSSGEDQEGQNNVVVLSHGLWQRQFGSNPKIVGQTVVLDKKPHLVIGVLPSDFAFSVPGVFKPADMWAPAVLSRDNAQRGNFYLHVIARLKAGVTMQQAQSALNLITQQLAQEYPQALSGVGARVVPLHEQMVGNARTGLLIMLGAVGFVLLIACANVANLQLARASARQKEMVIRAALGASPKRMVRQLLTESVFLALLGGALGMLLAEGGTGLLSKLGPANLPGGTTDGISWVVFAFCLGVSVCTGILFGLAPALQLSSIQLNESLQDRSGGPAARMDGRRLRSVLMVSEVALSMILLIGAGLLIRSFVQLDEVKPGFATKDVWTVPLELPRFSYAEAPRQAALYQQALERVGNLPGVDAVGGIDDLPLTSDRDANRFTIEGLPPFDPGQSPVTQIRTVTPGYFRTMNIPMIKGRPFDGRDTSSALPVLLINQSFAQRFFPREDPIGRRVKFGLLSEPSQWLTIVGTVGDVRDLGLDANADLEVYVPYEQSPLPYLNLVVRAKGNPTSLAAAVRDEIHGLDKDLPLLSVRPMEAVLAASIFERQFEMILLSVFASLALLLAAVGIYGVISYSVSQQTRQIGIRMALGAQPADVLKLVLQSAIWQTLLGAAVGLAGALALTHVLKSQLYGVGPADPATIGGVALLVFAVALFASWLPAHRAARVDPMEALRYE
ncbi:MAG: hypothetical protein DME23_13390 [Verrucomicrobia bacterium]|nr:MAG: hypothetical protein DME23_13390 [Verrucomicrobiota bacterium]